MRRDSPGHFFVVAVVQHDSSFVWPTTIKTIRHCTRLGDSYCLQDTVGINLPGRVNYFRPIKERKNAQNDFVLAASLAASRT